MTSKYPPVKNAHIVPKSYLRPFSIEDRIAVHIDGTIEPIVRRIENVGTRRTYYRRTRPDGTEIDDIEASLAEIEERAAPALRTLVDNWPPLDLNRKCPVAQLFAAQLVRVPNWKTWHESTTRRIVEDYRANKLQLGITDVQLADLERQLATDTDRLYKMLQIAVKLMPVIASMHWTLVEFRRPVLCTSDQPVVVWPESRRSNKPRQTSPNVGVTTALEIRVPISPHALILMTWSDNFDEDGRRRGAPHHAGNVNAFTIAQADRQWFHQPGTNPPRADGQLIPISPELVPGYSASTAARSARRARAKQIADSLLGIQLRRGEHLFDIVTIRKPAEQTASEDRG